jgi:hypothetical protein
MFGNQFYPTPPELVDRMLKPYIKDFSQRSENFWGHTQTYLMNATSILEPEAGKGDIVDHLIKHYHVVTKNISCIELNDELCMILNEKGYKVIDHDFLTYDDNHWFDFIIMNPPFKHGAEHLLKAWEIVGSNGNVVCVLNAETLKNPFSNQRQKLLELIGEHGSYEFVEQAFMDGEHSTNVEIAIVWLHKPEMLSDVNFEGAFETDQKEKSKEFEPNMLANRNLIEALVAQYQGAKRATIAEHEQRAQYRFYVRGIIDVSNKDAGEVLNNAINKVKGLFWSHVFEKTTIGRMTTSEFQKKFERMKTETGNLAFSVANVNHVLDTFVMNFNSILEQCLLDTFDKATAYHKDNKIHFEGWKTNKSYKVTRKIIMPNCMEYEPKFGHWDFRWEQRDFLRDIDKVMCFLDGKSLKSILTLDDAVDAQIQYLNGKRFTDDYAQPFFSYNFKIKFFKKGTMHIEFRDEEAWNKFNLKAAMGKKWLGGGFE